MENALNNQIGGNHYKDMAAQPIELIVALKCSFIQGCIIKYASRYKAKNGMQDIKKCIHCAQLAIHLKDKKKHADKNFHKALNDYILSNNMSIHQRIIITQALYNNYEKVITACKDLIKEEYQIIY